MTKRREVLEGHVRKGKRLIPPAMHRLNLQEVSWRWLGVPELIWIGLLFDHAGPQEGTRLALEVAEAAFAHRDTDKAVWFGRVSAYHHLTDAGRSAVTTRLLERGALGPVREALSPLLAHYPECGMTFLAEEGAGPTSDRSRLKEVISEMIDRIGRPSTLIQATSVLIAFETEILKVMGDSVLLQLPAIDEYPDTEVSQRVASAVRMNVNIQLGGPTGSLDDTWAINFWNRGVELERCRL